LSSSIQDCGRHRRYATDILVFSVVTDYAGRYPAVILFANLAPRRSGQSH